VWSISLVRAVSIFRVTDMSHLWYKFGGYVPSDVWVWVWVWVCGRETTGVVKTPHNLLHVLLSASLDCGIYRLGRFGLSIVW
jgi:hypothetical protein